MKKYNSTQNSLFQHPATTPRCENNGHDTTDAGFDATALLPRCENNGHDTTPRRIFAVDPGQRGGCAISCPDERGVIFKDFLQFIQNNSQPGDFFVAESTAHLYNPIDRKQLIEAAQLYNVEIWVCRSVHTSRGRAAIRPKIEREDGSIDDGKDDPTDALAIRYLWETKPKLFYKLDFYDNSLGTKTKPGTARFELNIRLVEARRNKYQNFNEDGHHATMVIAAEVATEFNLSNRQFDKLCGFNGCGYPNIARSDRNLHAAGRSHSKTVMKNYRKKARKLFSLAKQGIRLRSSI
jgi:hypothetical protein